MSALVLLFACLMIFVAGCGSNDSNGEQGEGEQEQQGSGDAIKIRFGHAGTEDHQYHVFATKFKETVEENSGGEIEVEIFPNGTLGGDREMIESMLLGQQEMFVGGSVWSWVPEASVTDMPYLYRDAEHAHEALDGILYDELSALFENQGLDLMGYVQLGWRNISNNVRPINSADDVAGLSVRVPEADTYIATFDALNANIVNVDLLELYMALQQGVADGQDNPLSTFLAQSFEEVQDYLTLTRHIYATVFVLSNNDWINSLSEENQTIIRDAVAVAQEHQREVVAESEEEMLDEVIESGVEVNEPSDLESFYEATENVPEALENIVPMEWIEQIRDL